MYTAFGNRFIFVLRFHDPTETLDSFFSSLPQGTQNIPQLRESFGRDGTEAIVGLAATQIYGRANEPDSAEWVSRALGEQEVEELSESISYGGGEARDGINNSMHRHVRRLVISAEVGRLPNLRAYVKLGGVWPVAKAKIRYIRRPDIAEAFIEAPELDRQQSLMLALQLEEDGDDAAKQDQPLRQAEFEPKAGRGMI